MALQVIKETKLAAALCRLSPPNSPSKSSSKPLRGQSKILSAFDAVMLHEHIPPFFESGAHNSLTGSQKDHHPFLLTAGASRSTAPAPHRLPPKMKKSSPSRTRSTSVLSTATAEPSKTRAPPSARACPRSTNAETNNEPPLPLYSYKDYAPAPVVVYVRHEDEANELVQSLSGPLGFDMEWVVSWRNRAPSERRTAVIQLCDARMILIVQLSQMHRFPQKVKEVIESCDIVKMGANIKNDGEKLYRDYGVLASNLVELGAFAHCADEAFRQTYNRSIVALAKVVGHYTGKTLEKGKVRSSNWEAAPLSEEQLTYAANDAHCALIVYNRLLAIAAEQGRSLGAAPYGNSISPRATGSYAPLRSSSAGSAYCPVSYVKDADELQDKPRQSPQHLRAYNLWHNKDMPLPEICAALRTKDNPLKESTVISYVVRALQTDPALPYSMDCLKALVQSEAGSWARHRDWIAQADAMRKS